MLVSWRRISRKGVRLGKLSGDILLNGAIASRRSTSASVMAGSKAASQRCGRSTMGGVGGIELSVEHQIAFGAADTGEACALFRFGIRRLQIVHGARFDGNQAGPAASSAASRIDSHPLRPREFEQVSCAGLPADGFGRPAEG